MSVGVFDPFPSEQEFVEFGRPRSGDDVSEPVDFGEVADLSEVMDVGGVGDFSETANFGDLLALPAEGWVGDALERIPLLSASDGELLDAATVWDRILSWAAGNQARVVAEFASRRRYGRRVSEIINQ